MIVKVSCPPNVVGRVMVGPSVVRQNYFRIVSERGGSGRIEKFDLATRAWVAAPESVSFQDVWSAPPVSPVIWHRLGDKLGDH